MKTEIRTEPDRVVVITSVFRPHADSPEAMAHHRERVGAAIANLPVGSIWRIAQNAARYTDAITASRNEVAFITVLETADPYHMPDRTMEAQP
jgi:hypothetical protein